MGQGSSLEFDDMMMFHLVNFLDMMVVVLVYLMLQFQLL